MCAVLLVAGCASRQAYPRQWPAFTEDAQTCNGLSGEYRNEGRTAEGYTTLLSDLLFNRPTAITDTMTLSVQQGDRMTVRAELPVHEPLVLSEDDVSCHRGTLVLRAGGKWFLAGGGLLIVVGKRSTTLELHPIANGLVIRVKRRASGVVVAFPYTHSDETWHRFQRLPRQPGSSLKNSRSR